jgi:transcriptional regulator with XRE-family HTH domain
MNGGKTVQIYRQIVRICEEKNISIARLEKETGFALGTVRIWGAVMPSIDKMVKVADFLGVSVDELCERNVDNKAVESFVNELQKQSPDEAMLIQAYRLIPEEHRLEAMQAILAVKMKYEN